MAVHSTGKEKERSKVLEIEPVTLRNVKIVTEERKVIVPVVEYDVTKKETTEFIRQTKPTIEFIKQTKPTTEFIREKKSTTEFVRRQEKTVEFIPVQKEYDKFVPREVPYDLPFVAIEKIDQAVENSYKRGEEMLGRMAEASVKIVADAKVEADKIVAKAMATLLSAKDMLKEVDGLVETLRATVDEVKENLPKEIVIPKIIEEEFIVKKPKLVYETIKVIGKVIAKES